MQGSCSVRAVRAVFVTKLHVVLMLCNVAMYIYTQLKNVILNSSCNTRVRAA